MQIKGGLKKTQRNHPKSHDEKGTTKHSASTHTSKYKHS